MPRFGDSAELYGVLLGPASEAPGGARGSVAWRWFEGLAAGAVVPDADAVRRFLEELDEATGER